jgi:uncharacterized protein
MPLVARRAMLASLAFVPLAACSSPNPDLYTLAPVPGTPQSGGPPTVVLHRVAIARYLERPEIVRSSENYRLDVLANDQWGEPLAQMITRVLAANLTQRLPGTTVYSINGAITVPEDAAIEVNINRMDSGTPGLLAFSAQAAVAATDSHRPPLTRSIRTSIPITSATTADEVRAMSLGIGQVADAIAEMLREHPGNRHKA